MNYDVIIIGAGVAGMTAAIYASRAGKSVLVLENKICGGQIVNTSSIANWPGDPGVSGEEFSQKIYHQMNNFGAEVKYEEVIEVSHNRDSKDGVSGFWVKTDDSEYSCGAIIIATGTEPRKLSEKQMKDVGERPISYCATCDGTLYKDKPVVVVGSGNTAKHEIKYLENIASKVYHIHHDDPVPEDAVAVFVAIGRVPNTRIFSELVELNRDGYIVAEEDCHTSCRGVFVAGDCRTKDLRQLVTAAADGAVAASEAVKYLR
ncbi:FAD-dependent oxidoreductase [Candidatus Saccharibacteria bacterium]|nr:FAD-dependent oxidoreductase [Candidatus Saccharibacteria bacterium]